MRYLLVPLLLALCAPLPARTLVASVEPLAMVLRDLYGDSAEVVTLLEANQNPHNPMLSPRQMLTLRGADLLVWLGEAAEPAVASLVTRRDGESLALLSLPDVTRREGAHRHGGEAPAADGHHHEHGELDPHLWLDPRNMAALARALGQREALPAGQPDRFLADLERLEAALRERLAPFADTPWLTFHHPWGYFQQRLGLREPVIVSEQLGAGPSSRRFVALAQQLQNKKVRCAILEPEAQSDLIARLCPDCQRVALDPLGRSARPGGQGDDYSGWLSEQVAGGFAECLAP